MLTRKDVIELLTDRPGPCISLFMPTHRSRPETGQDPIRFKNLLRMVEESLLDAGVRSNEVKSLLREAASLRSDSAFWLKQDDGLACFIAPDFFLASRLPFGVRAQHFIGKQFAVKSLLPLLDAQRRFFILALSQDFARFFEATPHSMHEIPMNDVLLEEAAGAKDRRVDASLQFHSSGSTARRGRDAPAMYHGHDIAGEKAEADTLRFFRAVDRHLHVLLRGESAPLVLACVGYLASLYDSVNTYQSLLAGKVPGSPSTWADEELHAHASRVAEPALARNRTEARGRFDEALARRLASTDIAEIVPAAVDGRVETLFVTHDSETFGSYDSATRDVMVGQDGDDLIEFAVARTLLSDGQVFAVDTGHMPRDGSIAAMFRYAQ